VSESDELFIKESPYRPPEADLQPAREVLRKKTGAPQGIDPNKIDPSLAVQYPFTNPEWWKTALLLGILQLVPIVGIVAAYGWMQRIYDDVRTGSKEMMPSVSVGDDLGRGWRLMGILFVGWMLLMVIMWTGMFVPMALAGAVGAIGGEEAGGAAGGIVGILVMIPMFVGMLGMYVVMPDLLRRCLNGDWFGMLRWNRAVRVIFSEPVAYLTLLASMILAMILLYVGMFALYIGMLFSMPIGMAVGVHALAQWDRYLDHNRVDHRE